MDKIGIATVYTGYNYGSTLQAFATTKILKNLGLRSDILKLRGSLIAGRDIRLKKLLTIGIRSLFVTSGIKNIKNYKKSISKKIPEESSYLFKSFINNELTPTEISESDLKKRARTEEYRAFLCGSDQVWNSAV